MKYYSEYERIKHIETLFERLAYFSVGLDFLVALATLLVLYLHFSNFMLEIADYLMLLEVIIASFIIVVLVVLKHYNKLIERLSDKTFKGKHYNKSIILRLFAKLIGVFFE
ncbi:MAG: hypothetical protein ACP5RI_00910 [Candidatus Micrarchaeia archaeon]